MKLGGQCPVAFLFKILTLLYIGLGSEGLMTLYYNHILGVNKPHSVERHERGRLHIIIAVIHPGTAEA